MDPLQAESVAENWAEHTHTDGRLYYYNKVTCKSLWEKPDCLTKNSSASASAWKEYKTPEGKSYYHNIFTQKTTWEIPEELQKKPAEGAPPRTQTYDSLEERREAFFSLFTEHKVGPKMKWEDVIKLVQDDKRFSIFTSGGEKRQLFGEYLNLKQREDRENLRKKRLAAKDDLMALLRSNVNDTYEIKVNTTFREVYEVLSVHECWDFIEADNERDEIFQDFMDEFDRNEREKKREEKREMCDRIKEKIKDDHTINSTTKWRDIQSKFKNDEDFKNANKCNVLMMWEDYVKDLMADEKNEAVKEKQKRERLARASFRKELQTMVENKKILISTEWNDFVNDNQNSPILEDIISYTSLTARDLFYESQDPLQEKFEEDKSKIRKIMRDKEIDLTSKTTFKEFKAQFDDRIDGIPEEHLQMTLDYYVDKAAEREKEEREEEERERRKKAQKEREKEKEREEEERRERRKKEKFADLLEDTSGIKPHMTYEDVEDLIGHKSEWKAISESQERKDIVSDYLQELKDRKKKHGKSSSPKRGDSDSGSEDDRQKKKKKKEKRDKEKEKEKEKEKDKKDSRKDKKDSKNDTDYPARDRDRKDSRRRRASSSRSSSHKRRRRDD